ncbi:unnamed protein product [Adineta ricciae]|uniref:Ig-like domain-containing protein n=1 Tax=Adineta ricciae TaxID=249248 RepID=A0A813R0X6_ADIRI|nr:unnamed protein product [Adineta ricciae]
MANTLKSLGLLLVLNTLIYSNGQFTQAPRNPADLQAALKQQFTLSCHYAGRDTSGDFLEWYRDSMPVKDEKPGHYVVKTSDKESNLTIKIFVKNDSLAHSWSVKTKKSTSGGIACRFNQIRLIQSPQSITTDKEVLDASESSVRRIEGESVNFACNVEPQDQGYYRPKRVRWEFSTDNHNFGRLPAEIEETADNLLKIKEVKKIHRGYYRCELNNRHFTVLLRVKDRLAALWPFLGIVGVVLILVFIILVFEKRQKATRKAATATNDEDNTRDPLVRTTNKSSDNDNKKNVVKA